MNTMEEAIQYMSHNKGIIKQFTTEQNKQFDELKMASPPLHRRWLGAPAGSGKSYLAVMLVAHRLRAMCEVGDYKKRVLLLSHSQGLCRHLCCELIFKLGKEATICNEDNIFGMQCVMYRSKTCVFICTIDWLCNSLVGPISQNECSEQTLLTIERSQSSLKSAFSLVVVDEAQHVFSFQRDTKLEGKHLFEDNSLVGDALEVCLGEHHQLLMFNDISYQSSDVAPIIPKFSNKQEEHDKLILRDVIRLPTSSRDVAMPFCEERNTLHSEDGVVDYYPVIYTKK